MAYNPVSGTAPQYQDSNSQNADGYYLKYYVANTTTPLPMATDSTGATTLIKCKLNPDGFPITNPLDNDTVFIPYVNRSYRQVIYRNEADADNNDTASALVNIAEVSPLVGGVIGTAPSEIPLNSDLGEASTENLSAFLNIPSASQGSNIEVVAGVIRKDANGTAAWSFINDSDHRPVGVDDPTITITASGTDVRVSYGTTYTKVISFVCGPDETFATLLGATTGASVGLSYADIKMNVNATWNFKNRFTAGTAVSTVESGKFTLNPSASYDNAGNATVVFDGVNATGITVSADTDGGAVVPYMPAKKDLGVSTATFNFIDSLAASLYAGAGNSSITWNWTMQVDRPLLLDGTEAAGLETVLTNGTGNIWFIGAFEV